MRVMDRDTFADHYRIPIHERVELPDELIPADSRVEIDAKITAGKFFNLTQV
jgi:GTP cyclohydrolase II